MTDEFGNFAVNICRTNPRRTDKYGGYFIAHHREEQVKHLHPAQQTCVAQNMSERMVDRRRL
jgi:hypothetical protein